MPLLSRGSFDRFEATATGPAADDYGLTKPQPFTVLREITRALQPVGLTFESAERRAVTLSGLRVTAGADVLLRRVAEDDTPLHVLSWSWDLSGEPVLVRPAPNAALEWTVPLSGTERRLGDRALELVPARRVVGCQSVRVILWQSDRGASAELVTEEVRAAIRHSRLASALAPLASSQATVMSAVGVRDAATELGREIAPVLRALCSDYVDLFEGFYPATETGRADHLTGFHSELTLRT
jgi:hypothetical protein